MAALSVQSASGARTASRERAPELGVRGDAADDGNPLGPELARRGSRTLDERADDRALIGGGEVGAAALELVRRRGRARRRGAPSSGRRRRSRSRARARPGTRRPRGRPPGRAGRARRRPGSRARAGERPCRRPRRRRRRASCRRPRSRRASRTSSSSVWPPLASRQRNGGSSGSGSEVERGDVAVQVVDGHEREPARPGERLRRREADEQRADQARPARDGDGLDVVEGGAALLERLGEHRADELEVPARGDLGHDAAVARVQLGLRGDDVGAHLAVPRDERDRGLVAGGLDPEDHADPLRPFASGGSFHMISASSRLSV